MDISNERISESSVESSGTESEEAANTPAPKPKSRMTADPGTAVLHGANLVWKDLCYEVPTPAKGLPCKREEVTYKRILNDLTGEIKPGEMMAILGPSGAGKTSFLNILARRVKATTDRKITGSIIVNGQKASHKYFKTIAGFVAQEDILMGSMTPWEALYFTAKLALGSGHSNEEIEEKVTSLLKNMGLFHVKDNYIGFIGKGSQASGIARGLSGGERKRVSVCVELIHNPLLLFLDEPTSGLDSYAAKTVITCMRELADKGRTMVCTIHQPSAELLKMFDKLLILGSGNTVYFGPTSEAPIYFESIGHPVPEFCNPGDHYLKVVQLGGKEKAEKDAVLGDIEEEGANLKDAIIDHTKMAEAFNKSVYGKAISDISADISKNKAPPNEEFTPVNFFVQLKLLVRRSVNNVIREPLLLRVRLIQTIIMSVFVGLIFLNLQNNQVVLVTNYLVVFLLLLILYLLVLMDPLPPFLLKEPYFGEKQVRAYIQL